MSDIIPQLPRPYHIDRITRVCPCSPLNDSSPLATATRLPRASYAYSATAAPFTLTRASREKDAQTRDARTPLRGRILPRLAARLLDRRFMSEIIPNPPPRLWQFRLRHKLQQRLCSTAQLSGVQPRQGAQRRATGPTEITQEGLKSLCIYPSAST